MSARVTRILIVDDPRPPAALRIALSDHSEPQIAGEAAEGRSAVRLLEEY